MQISEITPEGRLFRVYGEGEYLFSLYAKELKQYHLAVNGELEDAVLDEIYNGLLYRRARERALYLLDRKQYTVSEMRDRLRRNQYPECVIERVTVFLTDNHFLDDENYVRSYIQTYGMRRSRRQIMQELYRKGVSKAVIASCEPEVVYEESACFAEMFTRYTKGKDLTNPMVRQKTFRYFFAKGFPAPMIQDALNHSSFDS